jgi:hypothetical protein
MNPTFESLSENVPDATVPRLDREVLDVPPESLTPAQRAWREDGVVILQKFMPEALMDRYSALRARLKKPGGWRSPVPYMHYDELKDICLYRPLTQVMTSLVGESMGLHLNLTGWISTERTWHQDDYLNPPFIVSHYAAVWIALEDVPAESGPFEFVRGSHRWPLMRREKVLEHLEPGALRTPDWPSRAEAFVTPACEAEIARRGAKVEQFLGKRGDVLIWHGRLMHQGSKPTVPGTPRKALIAHYSAVSKRRDMPDWKVYHRPELDVSGVYFNIERPLDADERV